MNKLIKFSITFLFIFLFNSISFSKNITVIDVILKGNKNISTETVLANAGILKKNFITNLDELNLMKKKLFETNFFSSLDFEIIENKLLIDVTENPLIDFVLISGLDERKDFKNDIEKSLLLKSNLLFSRPLLNSSISLIKDYLKGQGYLNNKVNYQVNLIDNNKVNIFFDVELGNKFFIKNIQFIGDKKFSSAKLSSIISSREDYLLNFFSATSIPSVERLGFDILSLKNFYLSEGYYDIQISNSSINIINDNKVDVVFSINAGNQYVVSDYLIADDISFLDKNDVVYINDLIKKNINIIYNQYKLNKLKNSIYDFIIKKGYSANVSHSIKKISDKNLNLIFSISEIKEKKIIRNIKVIGNDITEEKVIRNNILFSEGDIFKEVLIKNSKDKLQSLYLFKDLDIKYNILNKSEFVDIEISLKEMPTGEISTGLGVGTSGSTIAFNLKENNFLGRGIKTDIGLSLGTQRILGNVSFSNPDFLNSGNTFKNNVFVTKTTYDSAGYENKLIGNNISYAYQIFEDTEFEAGFGLSADSIRANNSASQLIRSQNGNYFTSKIFYNFFNDHRDRKFQPTSGYTIGFGQNFAFTPSDIPYILNSFYGVAYKELKDEFTGSIKYKINSINSLNDRSLKLSDRLFFTNNELRGFSYRGVGPKVDNDFIGGNYSFLTSVSSTFPNGLPESWKAQSNIFLDIGNVWGSDISGIQNSNIFRSSVGLGFTWGSPIGPISFTYAEPLSKASSDDVENFNFRLGGLF